MVAGRLYIQALKLYLDSSKSSERSSRLEMHLSSGFLALTQASHSTSLSLNYLTENERFSLESLGFFPALASYDF